MSQPNILWICTDQQRWDTLGCHGNSWTHTPNLDQLASQGITFSNAYCQNPTCTPSRASFLTGRYPSTTRDRCNGRSISENEMLITRHLANHGYRCGLSGKLHLSCCHPSVTKDTERRIDDGYQVWDWSHDPATPHIGNAYRNWLHQQGIEFQTPDWSGTTLVRQGMPVEHHHTTWCADRAIDFINHTSGDKPWLFSLNIFDPHQPFDAPVSCMDRYISRLNEIPLPDYISGELEHTTHWQREHHKLNIRYSYDSISDWEHRLIRASYWAMVDLIDIQVGRVLDTLRSTGQDQNTIIIFMSDHGEMLGDHGIYLKGPYFYQQLAKVPLIIKGPGITPRSQCDGLVELVDLVPTLLDMTETPHYAGIQGKSFLSYLNGGVQQCNHRPDIFCEYHYADLEEDGLAQCSMIFDSRYKLCINHTRPVEGELYDLQADPGEHHNLWSRPEYSELQTRLLIRLCNRMAYLSDPLPRVAAPW